MSLMALEQWLSVNLPEAAASLNDGASQHTLDELSRFTGLSLPDSLESLYRWHDGQRATCPSGIFYGLRFLSLREVRHEWQAWPPPEMGDTAGAIKSGAAQRGWLPFATDTSGNFLAVDLDPGPLGQHGQVINCARGNSASQMQMQYVLASDVLQFVQWLQSQLTAGNFTLTARPGGGHRFNIAQPAAAHFLEAAEEMFGAADEEHIDAPPRDSLPGTVEVIRALLSAHVQGWAKFFVNAQLFGTMVTATCEYILRGADARQPLLLEDGRLLSAALLELRMRMQDEMGMGWRQIKLEYDADEEYSVSIDTT